MMGMVKRTNVVKRPVSARPARGQLGTMRPEHLRILVDDTPPSLDRRIAAWCRESWAWLISAGVHAAVTLLLMICSTSPEVIEPEVFHFTQTHDDEREVAPPTKLEQMSVAAPAARLSTSTVGTSAVSDAIAWLELRVDSPVSVDNQTGGGKSSRHSGPTDSARRVTERDEELLTEVGHGSQSAKFFGIEATGKRFIFVVDSSGSMKWSKWRRACGELVTSIESLGPDQTFCVYFFDSVPHLMFNQRPAELRLIKATPRNVMRVRRWMASVSFGNQTRPFTAVRHALSMRPDAVFLLSDGEFHDSTLAYFRAGDSVRDDGNSSDRVVVHTIGFKSRLGQETLRQIADRTGGTYRFVP